MVQPVQRLGDCLAVVGQHGVAQLLHLFFAALVLVLVLVLKLLL